MKQLIRVTGLLTISGVITRLLGLIFFVVLARSVSVADYGLFRYLLTIASLYALFFTGIPTALVKFVGENKKNPKKLNEYVFNAAFLMIVIFIILCLVIISFEEHKLYLILLLLAYFVDFFYIGFIRGLLNYSKLVGFKLLENVIQLTILIISYIIYQNINFTFAIIFFSFAGILSLILFEVRKSELKFKFNISKQKITSIIKYTLPLILGSLSWTIMFGINTVFIKKYIGLEYVGFYSVGETIVQIFTFLPVAIATITFPKIVNLKDKSKIIKPLNMAVLFSVVISAIMLIGLMLFRKDIITLIFTEKYVLASTIILPLAIGQISISLHQIYTSVFQGLNKPLIPSITILIACILNIIGSYILTSHYGIIGAAISNAVTSTMALIMIIIIFQLKWKTLSKIQD